MAKTVLHGTSDWRYILEEGMICSDIHKRCFTSKKMDEEVARRLAFREYDYREQYNIKKNGGNVDDNWLRDTEKAYTFTVVEGYLDLAARLETVKANIPRVVLEFAVKDTSLFKPSSELNKGGVALPIYNIWGHMPLRNRLVRVVYAQRHMTEELEYRLRTWPGVKLEHKDFK